MGGIGRHEDRQVAGTKYYADSDALVYRADLSCPLDLLGDSADSRREWHSNLSLGSSDTWSKRVPGPGHNVLAGCPRIAWHVYCEQEAETREWTAYQSNEMIWYGFSENFC